MPTQKRTSMRNRMRATMRPRLHTRMTVALTLIALTAACRPERTDQGIETTTSEGRLESPSGELAQSRGVSLVRMINALPENRTISISADDHELFTDISHKGVSTYIPLSDNVARFRVRDSQRDTTIASDFKMLMDGSHYTIVTLPERGGGVRLHVMRDEVGADSTAARVRFVNGSVAAGRVDVTLDGRSGTLFDNVDVASETGFETVVPTNAALHVRTDAEARPLLSRSLKLAAGHSYTVILTGAVPDALDMLVVEDQLSVPSAVIVP